MTLKINEDIIWRMRGRKIDTVFRYQTDIVIMKHKWIDATIPRRSFTFRVRKQLRANYTLHYDDAQCTSYLK